MRLLCREADVSVAESPSDCELNICDDCASVSVSDS